MAKKSAKRRYADPVPPTPEQMAHSPHAVERITERGQVQGERYRKIRQVEWMLSQDQITRNEAAALITYRMYADQAEWSLTQDSLGKHMPQTGGGGDIPPAVLNARRMAGVYEAAAGSLRDILRAVVLEDKTLSEWAIDQYGGIEDCEVKNGVRICRIKPKQKALAIAKIDIRTAARRIIAEMDA